MIDQPILFEERHAKSGAIGIITLNHPHTLNALTKEMGEMLYHQLVAWENYHDLLAVVITTDSSRAFCSGGDLKALYQCRSQKNQLLDFFYDEYSLNNLIKNYKKPFVALLQGIVMGGGAGISIHGSHRVGCESLVFAMPEAGIGLFTDVGSSYFFNRAPGYLGRYLALSGAKINVADAHYAGFIDYCISSNDFSDIIDVFTEIDFNENTAHETISTVLQEFAVEADESWFQSQQHLIDRLFAFDDVKNILEALHNENSDWAKTVHAHLLEKSPTSLCIILELLKRAKNMTLRECLEQDFCIVQTIIEHNDFFEGIRALLIDKDLLPQWQPASINDISQEHIAAYFSSHNKRSLF